MRWLIDPAHSSVEFSVRHMAIATVRGRFRDFTAEAELDEDGNPNAITASIRAASIDTGVADRDAHLRSPDFLNVERFPTVTFRSTAIESLEANHYRVTGHLTIRAETHPVTFALERTDAITDPWGNRRIAGALTGKLDRRAWGLTWNQALEFGALLVGEEVTITIDVQVTAPLRAEAAA